MVALVYPEGLVDGGAVAYQQPKKQPEEKDSGKSDWAGGPRGHVVRQQSRRSWLRHMCRSFVCCTGSRLRRRMLVCVNCLNILRKHEC